MRIWITGAAGFVGRRLVARLGAQGHEVIGVDREVEIRDAPRVARQVAAARPDAIVHLAALASGAQAQREPELAAQVNFLGTRSVLEAALGEAPQARVLLVSSGEVYGSASPESPAFREGDPLRPGTPYARSKACADLLGGHYSARGLAVLRARPFNHTGPGQSAEHFVAPSFARQVAEIRGGRRRPPLRVGNLDSVRDFLDVDDVVDAYARLLDPGLPTGVYNIASGVGLRIGDLLGTLLELAGVECEISVDPERLRPSDRSVGDATRLRGATGWAPRTPLRDTLERLLRSFDA